MPQVMTTIFISWTCFLIGLFVIFAGLSLIDARSVVNMTSTLGGGFAALVSVRTSSVLVADQPVVLDDVRQRGAERTRATARSLRPSSAAQAERR